MSILWFLSFFVVPVSIVPATAILSTFKLVYIRSAPFYSILNPNSPTQLTPTHNTLQPKMPSINFPTTYEQSSGECWSDEDDGSDCECGECCKVPLLVWFSCPICSSRMTQVNMCLLCEVCLATTNHLVWVSLFELEEYYNSNRWFVSWFECRSGYGKFCFLALIIKFLFFR
jgi:hypothetical protein